MRKERRSLFVRLVFILAFGALALWIAGPWHPTLELGSVRRDLDLKLGLDLQGGVHLVYRANTAEVPKDDRAEALAGVRDVIERRVNAFGVSEPVVQTNRVGDEDRVIVELAGVHDSATAIALIGETPQLDFRREIVDVEADEQFNTEGEVDFEAPIFERTELTGRNLKRSTVAFDNLGQAQVNLEFDSEGKDLFAELTGNSLGRRIAIYLDGVPISAPVVQAEITNGQAVISGGFTLQEAQELVRRLNAGALPVPIELIGQQTVGPSLGRVSIQNSVTAGLIGLVAVVAWMLIYYRVPGIVASVALVLYAVYFLAIVKLLPITLTLAGIAGFILSVGMAVDANVLIFERMRENLRDGKSTRYSIDHGFAEAWNSIKAANVSSLLTGLILYGFGTSIIRGFALTFSLGVLLSMVTAIMVTRTLLLLTVKE